STLTSADEKLFRPKIFYLGKTPTQEVYRPLAYYEGLQPVKENVKILRFEAPLNFVTVSAFLDKMSDVLHGDANGQCNSENPENNKATDPEMAAGSSYEELSQRDEITEGENKRRPKSEVTNGGLVIIVDCGAITSIDSMGVEALKEVSCLEKAI
ncbi:unnamed protein product, partial [Gongylonema pulchrum]|uniref:STAS domain-containing protein n=1 Tax=Gongylonema pulchrum TaxID=637853 RepID=A0A183EN23_9BILA